jgi:two-component system, LuxR family, secretion system response regulator SsrB
MQKNTLNLLQKHAYVFEQHSCHVNEQDYDAFDDKMSSMLKIWNIESSMYSVCDLNRKCFLHLSPRLHKLLGFGNMVEWCPGKKDGIYALIHTEDLPFVLETEILVYDYLHALPLHEKLNYTLVYDFRIKMADLAYCRLAHRLIVLEYDKFGNSWLALLVSDLLSNDATDDLPRRFLINIKTKELCLFCNDIGSKSSQLLTRRETEVLSLISQGLDSAAISEKLYISNCTVSNHKQNILEKTRAGNLTQAVNFVKILGFI